MYAARATAGRFVAAGLILLATCTRPVLASNVTALLEKYHALESDLRDTPFDEPLHLTSAQTESVLSGEVYAVVDHPFATIRSTLHSAAQWCDVLILHLNVKNCRASAGTGPGVVTLSVGRKHEQALAESQHVPFLFQVHADATDHLALRLHAARGPFGTRDYQLSLEVVPLDADRSFLHLSYSYTYGTAARLAMLSYLGTLGRNRVGFTTKTDARDGRPIHVGGLRGVVERNAMRYYLAIGAYLDTASAPAQQRQEMRLRAWFAATERYPLQLRDLTEAQYLAMKRNELARQRGTADQAE